MRLTSRLYAMKGFFRYLSRTRERLKVRKRAKATRGGSAGNGNKRSDEVRVRAHIGDGRHAQLELHPELHMQPSAVALQRTPPCLPVLQFARTECCCMGRTLVVTSVQRKQQNEALAFS